MKLSKKIKNISNNRSRKKIQNNTNIRSNKKDLNLILNDKQKEEICKKFATFDTFEDKVEQKFKDAGIDFLSTNYNLEKKILSDLKKAVSPSKITPNNDFYSYINERWLKDYNIEADLGYIIQLDNFRLVQDKVYRELLQIANDYIKENQNSRKAKIMSTYINSFSVWDTLEQSLESAMIEINKIDAFRKEEDGLWKLLGYINSNEIINHGCPFVWSVNPDDKNPEIYKCFIGPVKLTLLDIMVYFDDGTDVHYKKKYKNTYIKFLKDLFENAFGKNHNFNIEDIINVELKLLNVMTCDILKESPDNYNLVTKQEALEKYEFDWDNFGLALGFKETPNEFIATNLNYLLCCTQLLKKEWNSEEWRTYWIYIFIRQQQRFNEKGRSIFFDFHGKFERGAQQQISQELIPIFGLSMAFNSFLQNAYIEKYNNTKYVNYVKTMVEDFRIIFMRIIKRNNWLQPKTKQMALSKLENFKMYIGSHKIPDDEILLDDYSNTNAWYNLKKVVDVRHKTAVNLINKKVIHDIAVVDWTSTPPKLIGTQSYLVNAFYTPTRNSITIPLAYIQKPFVDLDERGIEYNLAHVGFTIGHEMSHALDDWGSKYNANGVLDNWWTEKDKKKFNEIKKDIIKEYEDFAKRDGIDYDATISIGENLADITSITICREYLRDFQLKNEDILPIQTLSFEVFFVYFAFQYRQKISKEAIKAHLKTDPHPLDKYRCNVPLTRLPVFRTIFNVKKGDGMWWHSTNRVWEN
jgi:putative endopeptidase